MIPFEDIAAKIIADRDRPVAVRVELLRRLAPGVTRQLETDRGRSGPLIFWGQSGNRDELAALQIVDPAILAPLLLLAGMPLNTGAPHAGVQHTYGYLFSTIDTPFGKKRDRWTTTCLEKALGLEFDTLSPQPRVGTLLANATWVAGRIAFATSPRVVWLERCLRQRISPDLRQFDWNRRTALRLTETVSSARSGNTVHILTDIVRAGGTTAEGRDALPSWLLVYSIHDERVRWPSLITMFTVNDDFVTAVQDRARIRKRSDIRLRFNAIVPGLPADEMAGTVRLFRQR